VASSTHATGVIFLSFFLFAESTRTAAQKAGSGSCLLLAVKAVEVGIVLTPALIRAPLLAVTMPLALPPLWFFEAWLQGRLKRSDFSSPPPTSAALQSPPQHAAGGNDGSVDTPARVAEASTAQPPTEAAAAPRAVQPEPLGGPSGQQPVASNGAEEPDHAATAAQAAVSA
jgi:hypothetical protein